MIVAGPIFDRVDAVLRDSHDYTRFRARNMTRDEYANFLDVRRASLIAKGVPDEDVDYAKRYPADRDDFVRAALARLSANGIIDRDATDPELMDEARRRARRYNHGGRSTYIYPEESDLLAAMTDIRRPGHILFLGSYYGYWAAATLPALALGEGTATLVDPDPDCCRLAESNLKEEVARGRVKIACTTGEALLAGSDQRYDMVVIDAEVPRDHPDPALRGKGVYASLLAAAMPRLADRALVICHNILLKDNTGTPVFADILARNRHELGPFLNLARTRLSGWTEIESTEGVGVGSFRAIAS